ncbi:MAG: YjbH domain-containing protein [Alphaproteobacteria bacterium]
MQRLTPYAAAFLCFLLLPLQGAAASHDHYSPNLTGAIGLNSTPSARMDEAGTMRIGAGTSDPYLHSFIGAQIISPVFVGFRQSAEISSLRESPERLYPGLDTKIRLFHEHDYRPEIALGLQSAFGHQRTSAEYLAFSKRYHDFDFTAGLGWGRLAGAKHVKNPMRIFSNHFKTQRDFNSEIATTPENWFTGEHIGFFGGVEYFTAIQGLSVKLDWNGDRYAPETAMTDFKAPDAFGFGVNYAPRSWVDASLGIQGTDKIMARLSFKTNAKDWPFHSAPKTESKNRPVHIGGTQDNPQSATRAAWLHLSPHQTAPEQIIAAAAQISEDNPQGFEAILIRTRMHNFKGPQIRLNRRDLENFLDNGRGSASELWRSGAIETSAAQTGDRDILPAEPLIDFSQERRFMSFILDNRLSLAEKDNPVLYRSSFIVDLQSPTILRFLHAGTALRVNLHDNLKYLNQNRIRNPLPVRSDEDLFAENRLGLDSSYLALTHSFSPSHHIALSGGYLEEMYAGYGGEFLYRPFGKRYALGVDSWLALKRDPLSTMAMGLSGDHLLSGHLNGWYEFPESSTTLGLRYGRFLAEDMGAEFSIRRDFQNGARLEGFTTLSNAADLDIFGGTSHAYHGIRFTLPIGSAPIITAGSHIRVTAHPFGRDSGQSLQKPIDLYQVTQPLSYSHLATHWTSVKP